MELGLSRHPDRAGHREGQVGLRDEVGRQACLACRLGLGPQLRHAPGVLGIRERRRLLPVAVDVQLLDDLGGAADRGGLRVRVQPGALGAAGAAEMVVDQRVQGRQFGRRVSGDPGGEPSGLQYGYLASLPGQFPGRTEARDATPDHRDIDGEVTGRRGSGWLAGWCRLQPVRSLDSCLGVHGRRVPPRRRDTRNRAGAAVPRPPRHPPCPAWPFCRGGRLHPGCRGPVRQCGPHRASKGILFGPVVGRRFDLVVSNPPYAPTPGAVPSRHRAAVAWHAGADGCLLLDRICRSAHTSLRPGGVLLLVHSTSAP